MNITNGENMSHLKPLKTVSVTTDTVLEIGRQLKKNDFNNIILLNKPRIVIIYSRLLIHNLDGTNTVLEADTSLEVIEELSGKLNSLNITGITIITLQHRTLYYDADDLKALYGFSLLCHNDLAVEFMKTILFNICYDKPKLLELCARNPLVEGYSENYLERLNIKTSQCLSEDDVSHMENFIEKVSRINLYSRLKQFRDLDDAYPMSLKAIEVNRVSLRITVYDDIRTIRFLDLNNNSNSEYISSEEAPKSPRVNDVWYDPSTETEYKWIVINNVPRWEKVSTHIYKDGYD